MIDQRLTPSQRDSVTARNRGILVSAGAGSGKSHVLVERLKSYILSDESRDLDSFVIITYTKAAAAELRGKISDALAEELAEAPLNARLRRQVALLGKAKISTIHSYCASILRENSGLLEGRLSPDFKIADDDRMADMRAGVLDRVLDECYENPELIPNFSLLVELLNSNHNDSGLIKLVLDLHSRMQAHARPEQWAAEQRELLCKSYSDPGETPWGIAELNRLKRMVEYWVRVYDDCIDRLSSDERVFSKYGPAFEDDREKLCALADAAEHGWKAAKCLLPMEHKKLSRLPSGLAGIDTEYAKNRRDACKKALKGITLFSIPDETLLKDLKDSCDVMTALLELTVHFDREFIREKRGFNLADYSDLEHLAAELLTNPDGSPTALAIELGNKYTEVMVDEYQDVSGVQEAIFNAVTCGGKKLFAVGDIKQSIYRFRLADPQIFNSKLIDYPLYREGDDSAFSKVLLRENFRSRHEILDCANAVFENIMSSELGDTNYGEEASLICGNMSYPNDGLNRTPELMLLELPDKEDGEESPNKVALEAGFVAAKIKTLVEERALMIGEGEKQRPAEYGDFAVLISRANSVSSVYQREFSKRGVPLSSGTGSAFYESPEIVTVISVLDIISNPHMDVPLLNVLRSPLFGFTPDDLAAFRSESKRGHLISSLRKAASANPDNAKFSDFLNTLDYFRAIAPDLSIEDLLWTVYNRTDALAVYGAMDDGAHRRSNLISFTDTARRFEATGYRGIYRFVKWLQRVRSADRSPSGAAESNSVAFMTMHKSKGLQFPVVFICDTAHGFNDIDSKSRVQVHGNLGLGATLIDREKRISYPTLAHKAIAKRRKHEDRSEQIRLLYVALTRAQEYMFITGVCSDSAKLLNEIELTAASPMEPEVLLSQSSPLKWLLSAASLQKSRLNCVEYKLDMPELSFPSGETAAAEDDDLAEEKGEALRRLSSRLSFEYPYKNAEALASKITATGLKGRRDSDLEAAELKLPDRQTKVYSDFELPRFGEKEKVTPAMRGTATHMVLQYGDYNKLLSVEGVEEEISRLVSLGKFAPEEGKSVDRSAISSLMSSEIGCRLLNAENVHREFKFSVLRPAEKLLGYGGEEQVLLQGIIDCFFEEKDGLVILDYKTDHVFSNEAIEKRVSEYLPQMEAYVSALSGIYSKPVKECILCFLESGIQKKVV